MAEGKRIIEVNPDVEVNIINVGGDLSIDGGDSGQAIVIGELLKIENEGGDSLQVFAGGDCQIQLPTHATLSIVTVGGDLKVFNILSPIEIGSVGGDAVLRDIESVDVSSVGGDLLIKRATADVVVQSVSGDLEIRDVDDDVTITSVGGDTVLRQLSGDVAIEHVGGDLIARMDFDSTVDHTINSVQGDVVYKLTYPASVQFEVPAETAHTLEIRPTHISQEEELHITLAEGESTVRIEHIGGELILTPKNDQQAFDAFIDETIGDAMGDMAKNFVKTGQEWASKFKNDSVEREEKIRRKMERVEERVKRAAERIGRHAERQAERMARQAEATANQTKRKNKGFSFNFGPAEFSVNADRKNKTVQFEFDSKKRRFPSPPPPPPPPPPPSPPSLVKEEVTETERMLILKMLETQQISVEEAERLFAALEGRDM